MSEPARLLLQAAVVLVVARLLGTAFQRIRQPRVLGEMTAGILLGPTLFGSVAPGLSSLVFPPASLGTLLTFSQVGLVLFMFLIGLSLNVKQLHESRHEAILISHVSIILPFALAALLAFVLYGRFSDDRVNFVVFALFLGAAMSITAFPVLARILSEQNLLHTPVGMLTIACAAVDDVTGWCCLAYIVVLARVNNIHRPVWITIGGVVLFSLLMVTVVRRVVKPLADKLLSRGFLGNDQVTVILVLLLACAVITDLLGLHLLFGAFLLGAIMPKEPQFISSIREKFESLAVTLLLPLFFASTGLRTSLNLLREPRTWAYCLLIILVATAGKLGGCMIAARALGKSWRSATAVGLLMNTRGLMELVILNIGLDIGVLSPALFSMMVLMALATSFMTTPLLEWVYPARVGTTDDGTCNGDLAAQASAFLIQRETA